MNIIPISDLRDTNKIAELCQSSNEPVFITKNGYGSMVIMNIETYEQKEEEKIILERLVHMNADQMTDGEKTIADLREKYGL